MLLENKNAVAYGGSGATAHAIAEEATGAGDSELESERPSRAKPLRDRAYEVVMRLLGPMERLVARSSLVPNTPFLDTATFRWSRLLEGEWRVIRRELDEILAHHADLPAFHEIAADVSDIAHEQWKTFFFYGYGFRAEENCARCPQTAALLREIPGLTTAFFSILGPDTSLPLHRGPWNGVLRYHLGLMVPEPPWACGIAVDGQVEHWREGESLLFDDSFPHRAWNNATGNRVVLFLDVMRPCRFPGSWVNRAVIALAARSPFLRDARRRHRQWELRFGVVHPVAGRD